MGSKFRKSSKKGLQNSHDAQDKVLSGSQNQIRTARNECKNVGSSAAFGRFAATACNYERRRLRALTTEFRLNGRPRLRITPKHASPTDKPASHQVPKRDLRLSPATYIFVCGEEFEMNGHKHTVINRFASESTALEDVLTIRCFGSAYPLVAAQVRDLEMWIEADRVRMIMGPTALAYNRAIGPVPSLQYRRRSGGDPK